MILTNEQKKALSDNSVKWLREGGVNGTWWDLGSGSFVDIDFDKKHINSLGPYWGTCKDYLKMVALSINTGVGWPAAEAPTKPYHWQYAAYAILVNAESRLNEEAINTLCKKWNLPDIEVFYITTNVGRMMIVVGPSIWLKSVELASTFVMICRSNYRDTNASNYSDYKTWLEYVYPYVDHLTELCQYGYANLNCDLYIQEHHYNDGSKKSEFNNIIHSYTGPSFMARDPGQYMKDSVYAPRYFYYDYFKNKRDEQLKRIEAAKKMEKAIEEKRKANTAKPTVTKFVWGVQ